MSVTESDHEEACEEFNLKTGWGGLGGLPSKHGFDWVHPLLLPWTGAPLAQPGAERKLSPLLADEFNPFTRMGMGQLENGLTQSREAAKGQEAKSLEVS